jgi:hypothetical protein
MSGPRLENTDDHLGHINQALAKYRSEHPDAQVDAYRQNSVSLRARIVDPDFHGIDRADRHEIVWRHIATLPEEVQSEVTMLLLLTPEETKTSFANLEFDHPLPSML